MSTKKWKISSNFKTEPWISLKVYVTDVGFRADFTKSGPFQAAPLHHENAKLMSTMKMINNAGLKSRIRQVLFLLIVIIIGILISHALGA